MGWNTTVVVYNDALTDIKNDRSIRTTSNLLIAIALSFDANPTAREQ